MFNLGAGEILIILFLALILIGPGKIPEVGRFLGKIMRKMDDLKQEISGLSHDTNDQDDKNRS